MSLFELLNNIATSQGLGFLVIGGHAVIEYGYQRGTEDADILVSKEDREKWQKSIEQLGYRLLHDGGTFLQFTSPLATEWDLDLMLVPTEVFTRLKANAKAANLEGVGVTVPSLEHLLALKIHALKHGHGLRVLKDLTDVAHLLNINKVDPQSPWLLSLFERYGSPELYERVKQLLA